MTSVALKDLLELADAGVWGDEDPVSGVSVLRSTNFRVDGRLDFESLSFRSIDEPKRTQKTLREGDILLEKSGGGPKQPVGRVCLYRGHELPHAFGNFLSRLRPRRELVEPEFLFYRLWHFHREGLTTSYQKQTSGIRNLETKRYLEVPVELPSLAEQRRIIDQLARAENIVRMRREAEAKAKEIIPALFVDMFGDPEANPKRWQVRPLSDIAKFVSGGTPTKSNPEYWTGNLPWVSPKDMKIPEIRDSEDHVSPEVPRLTSLKLIPANAILIVVRGMILVHTAPVAITHVPVTINQDMKALLVEESVNPVYLMWLLRISQRWLLSLVTTAAHGTKKIDTSRLELMNIPLPARGRQDTFALRVKSMLTILSAQTYAIERAEEGYQSILAGVFGNDGAAEAAGES